MSCGNEGAIVGRLMMLGMSKKCGGYESLWVVMVAIGLARAIIITSNREDHV